MRRLLCVYGALSDLRRRGKASQTDICVNSEMLKEVIQINDLGYFM